ncbi:MAG TPA: 30S ribosomal protein S12 methylthiotransferase RimO, partial [Bryobacteraceae bacterium]
PILIEGPSEETDLLWQGRLSTQAPEIDGVCYINDFGPAAPVVGERRTIRITEAHDYDLVGELVDPAEPNRRAASAAGPFVILPAASIPKSFPAAQLSSGRSA